jgi:hypothetical protein
MSGHIIAGGGEGGGKACLRRQARGETGPRARREGLKPFPAHMRNRGLTHLTSCPRAGSGEGGLRRKAPR